MFANPDPPSGDRGAVLCRRAYLLFQLGEGHIQPGTRFRSPSQPYVLGNSIGWVVTSSLHKPHGQFQLGGPGFHGESGDSKKQYEFFSCVDFLGSAGREIQRVVHPCVLASLLFYKAFAIAAVGGQKCRPAV